MEKDKKAQTGEGDEKPEKDNKKGNLENKHDIMRLLYRKIARKLNLSNSLS